MAANVRLDQPVDLCARHGLPDVVHDRQRVHDVAHRRRLDDQDPHHRCDVACFDTSAGFNRGSLYILNWR